MTQQGSKYFRSRFQLPRKNPNPLKWMQGASDSDIKEEYQKILKKESKFCATKRRIIIQYVNQGK